MKRRKFTIVSALSLLLFVATVALWVLSHTSHSIEWDFQRAEHYYSENGERLPDSDSTVGREGSISFHQGVFEIYDATNPRGITRRAMYGFAEETWFYRHGFEWHHRRYAIDPEGHLLVVRLPLWVIALTTGLLPGVWLAGRVRARKRGSSGFCAACGYNLCATPARCPECGAYPARLKAKG
jgi:4-amino-4-deoxy-L-arabinose transferase-like glycosyltransferase